MKLLLSKQVALAASLAFLLGCLLWSLWPVLAVMQERWSADPRYAHGIFSANSYSCHTIRTAGSIRGSFTGAGTVVPAAIGPHGGW